MPNYKKNLYMQKGYLLGESILWILEGILLVCERSLVKSTKIFSATNIRKGIFAGKQLYFF